MVLSSSFLLSSLEHAEDVGGGGYFPDGVAPVARVRGGGGGHEGVQVRGSNLKRPRRHHDHLLAAAVAIPITVTVAITPAASASASTTAYAPAAAPAPAPADDNLPGGVYPDTTRGGERGGSSGVGGA